MATCERGRHKSRETAALLDHAPPTAVILSIAGQSNRCGRQRTGLNKNQIAVAHTVMGRMATPLVAEVA